MAIRKCFISTPYEEQIFSEVEVDFTYYPGFALTQKQKSIKALHESVALRDRDLRVLEASTKSPDPIGVSLSAFNLIYLDAETGKEYPLENVFHAAKVFEEAGPFRDLLGVHPRDAKRDDRLRTSGRLTCFCHNNEQWELKPESMFYDWLYVSALSENGVLAAKALDYNAFTDIEFNHKKSFNCQARSLAIFVSLSTLDVVEAALENRAEFKSIYRGISQGSIW